MEPSRRLALLVEYEGTAYRGSQYQENAPTVQGSLERALSKLTGEPIRVSLAGRTDSGVHARGQVASFLTASSHPIGVITSGANAHLPRDIAVRAAAEVPVDFDPRRQAVSRWYRYTVWLRPQRPALMRRFAWHVTPAPDLGRMQQAARLLEGRYNFAAFTPPSEARRRRTERNVVRSQIEPRGGLAVFDIEANAFLPHMVRRIMGTLAETGWGKLGPDAVKRLLEEAPPGEASFTAPSRGLCLMKVRYESGLFDDETREDI